MKTTTNPRQGLSPDENRQLDKMLQALVGIPTDRAVAMLMTAVCQVADQYPSQADKAALWDSIEAGAEQEAHLARYGA